MKSPKMSNQMIQGISKIAAILGFLAVFILSMVVETIQFHPGQPLKPGSRIFPLFSIGEVPHGNVLLNLILILLLLMFPVGLIMLIFSSEARRVFKKYSKALLIWLLFMLGYRLVLPLFTRNETATISKDGPNSLPSILNPPDLAATDSLASAEYMVTPSLPAWLGYLMGFLFALGLGLLVYQVWIKEDSQENEIKSIALKTLADIDRGQEWEDAIIQCYAQMNTAVIRWKRISRQASLTPAEFANELLAAGLPSTPVTNLTRLFEFARYGQHTTRSRDATEAVNCLNDITKALERDG